MATPPRDVAESVARRVTDEFRRSGVVPSELVRHIQASAWGRGKPVTRDVVERYAREWINARLEAEDRKPQMVRHVEDEVEKAIELLATSNPKADVEGWSRAVATVQAAWQAGELTAAQRHQLDVLNSRYEQQQKAG